MKIAHMHPSVQEAVLERNPGLCLEDDMSPEQAMEEWSAWEIGDGYWARFMIEQLDKMRGGVEQ